MRIQLFLPLAAVALAFPALPQEALPGQLIRLIPPEATLLVYTPSIERTAEKTSALLGAIDAVGAEALDLEAMLGKFIPSPKYVDRSGPLCFAFTDLMGESPPAVLFRARESQALAEALGPRPHCIERDYCGLNCAAPTGEPAVRPLLRDLPPGDLVVRLDAARLVPQFRPILEAFLVELVEDPEEQSPADRAFNQAIADWLPGLFSAIERADLILGIEGTRIEFDLVVRGKPESMLAVETPTRMSFEPLARALPPEHAVKMLVGFDIASLDRFFLERLTAEEREVWEESMEVQIAFYGTIAGGLAASFGIGSAGIEIVTVMPTSDDEAFLRSYDEWLRTYRGGVTTGSLSLEVLPDEHLGDLVVRCARMHIPIEELLGGADVSEDVVQVMEEMLSVLFGEEGLPMRLAVRGGRAVWAMGGSRATAHRHLARGFGLPNTPVVEELAPELEHLLQHSEDSLVLGVAADLRRVVGDIIQLLAPVIPGLDSSPVPQGDPLWISLHLSTAGRTHQLSLELDVVAILDFIRSLEVF